MSENDLSKEEQAAIEAAWERSGIPPLRDILKREYNEARPRNEALEKWGPVLDDMISRDLERFSRRERQVRMARKVPAPASSPRKDGPDMDMG